MKIEALKTDVERYGMSQALYGLGMRAMNHACYFHVLRGIHVAEVEAEQLRVDAGYVHRFLEDDELRRLSRDAAHDLDPRFVEEAIAGGDRCYGVLEGDTLASYGWYATRPTPISEDLILRFSPRYAYMYKGFTHPAHRGRRLHAIGMGWALHHLVAGGLRGLVSYVDSTNFASLKSCYRLGYRDFGSLYVLRAGTRYVLGRDRGCEAFGFRLDERSSAASTAAA